ncbi:MULTISPECIES: hypothetical protein [unclassified Adlercreutzia]|uniref:hypothetical protein n=1 Tax=unclassified Adlercreutzia TaxID=2636013 RepID=UPI0013EDB8E4|nr:MULTISPECIES: hypothetical protein [unclassified Adlercreutzia]
MGNMLPAVMAAFIYLIPLVVALLILKKFFDMAQATKESAEALKQVAAAQREQTEMLRELMSTLGGMNKPDLLGSEHEQD